MRDHPAMQTPIRSLLVAALLAGAAGLAPAHTSVGIGVNIGVPAYGAVYPALPGGAVAVTVGGGRYWRYGGAWYRPWGPRWVVVAPPVGYVVAAEPPPPPPPAPPAPPAKPRPDPIIYPRNGQDSQQTEADRQDCNRWAVTQPQAMLDADVFSRAVEACMDGRGYSMR